MISRLSAFAALFAVLVTASLAVAASAQQHAATQPGLSTKAVRVMQLERVTIVARRLQAATR